MSELDHGIGECVVCGEELEPSDGVVAQAFDSAQYERAGDRVDHPVPAAGWRYWVHVGCTRDGVRRWCRAGRPTSSPVEWTRENGLNWTGMQGSAERARLLMD